MKNFRESYKKAVDAIPIPDFYVREISQTERGKDGSGARGKRGLTAAAFAGGMVLICALGGVAADCVKDRAEAGENDPRTAAKDTNRLHFGYSYEKRQNYDNGKREGKIYRYGDHQDDAAAVKGRRT